jgi:hypothetical protein
VTILRGAGPKCSTRSKKTFGGGFVAPLLHQNVEFRAMLLDRTPQEVRFATQCDEPLVEVPRATRLTSRRFYMV